MKPEVGAVYRQVVAEGLTRTQLVAYAGASGDFHPFHHDETYATAHGFDRIFAHGMLTMGISGQALVAVFGPEGLDRYAADFLKPVWPGDTLTAELTVTAANADGTVEVDISTTDQHGTLVLRGSAAGRLAGG
ncbi:MAG: MaoC family dehydratase [bacterium]|nr:MaoC family dehydratase [bacterium]MCY3888350.1 MaoC family dehydratase [bacterium]MCY3961291.1 MaoC family dehydratase [bacterium]MCY4136110.1 MaoC family dehydratase [bacterium]